jgi:cell fate regulator YaaT (PSP1 superfamily)
MMDTNENVRYDCFRGCVISGNEETGVEEIRYRQGCCKLEVYNYLKGIGQEQYDNLFEVRFKNTRKGIYVNGSGQSVKTGDLVVVEAQTGHDLGIVTLEGPIVARQMKCKGIDPEKTTFRKIYRRARPYDIERWQDAIAREQETMIRSRVLAANLGLEMKIGDVEFQGDGTKAIFYYIADGRVDFRQLIKDFAEEFHIRVEMKQIGARQEAGLIGGLGICGRELCCANYITEFKSITTSAARVQDLSLNPQKLAGQCGKLKCCLNYEVAAYQDAHSRIPKVSEPLEFQDGLAYLVKTDILRETMYFSYEKGSLAKTYPLPASEVREIIMMNRNGQKPETLLPEAEPVAPEFVTAVGDDSISRFDEARKKKRKKNKGGNRGNNKGAKGGNAKPKKTDA